LYRAISIAKAIKNKRLPSIGKGGGGNGPNGCGGFELALLVLQLNKTK
jgi:hypothetical protein